MVSITVETYHRSDGPSLSPYPGGRIHHTWVAILSAFCPPRKWTHSFSVRRPGSGPLTPRARSRGLPALTAMTHTATCGRLSADRLAARACSLAGRPTARILRPRSIDEASHGERCHLSLVLHGEQEQQLALQTVVFSGPVGAGLHSAPRPTACALPRLLSLSPHRRLATGSDTASLWMPFWRATARREVDSMA